jgi:hypothetical protein
MTSREHVLARPRTAGLIAVAALLTTLMSVTTANNASARANTSHPAHLSASLRVDDTAHLHYVKEADAQLIDEGPATGTVHGTVRVGFNVGATVAASFAIYTHEGAILGHGTGTLHKNSNPSDIYLSFGGTLTVTHGTGRYAHAHGTGGFYGTIDRKNYAVTIQTTGTLYY